jgi:MoxR-like ATPase
MVKLVFEENWKGTTMVDMTYKHEAFDDVLRAVQSGVMPFMPGPAGCGKTMIAEQIAVTLGLPFYYASAVNSPYQLLGFTDAQGRVVITPFRKAYEEGGLFLFDEMDCSAPDALVALNTAIGGDTLNAPDIMVKRHANFRCMAAANTYGHGATLDYIGRNPLDGATLDRFTEYSMDYDQKIEQMLVDAKYPKHRNWVPLVQTARAKARELGIRQIISTRACLQGAALLTSGFSRPKTFEMTVAKGLSEDDRTKLWHAVDGSSDLKQAIKEAKASSRAAEEVAARKAAVRDVAVRDVTAILSGEPVNGGISTAVVADLEQKLGTAQEILQRLEAAQHQITALAATPGKKGWRMRLAARLAGVSL